jgi:hypothetical protein
MHDLLEEIIAHWGLELEPTAVVADDTVRVDLDGKDVSILTEDDGRVLAALQYIVSKVASRVIEDNVRVVLEAAGFRAGRDEALRKRAREVAEQVQADGRKIRLEPLNAYERRIIHIELKESEEVRTYSIGRGYLKRVTIELITDEDLEDEDVDAGDDGHSEPEAGAAAGDSHEESSADDGDHDDDDGDHGDDDGDHGDDDHDDDDGDHDEADDDDDGEDRD